MKPNKEYPIATVKQLRNCFWSMLKECNSDLAKEYRVKKRQNEYSCTVRSSWVGFVDSYQKDGLISEKLANRAIL